MPQSSSDAVALEDPSRGSYRYRYDPSVLSSLEVPHTNRYRLATKFEVLTAHYPASVSSYGSRQKLRQQSIYRNPPVLYLCNKNINKYTSWYFLQLQASKMFRPVQFKNNAKCSVHCHSSEFDGANLSSLLRRTEIALVPQQPTRRNLKFRPQSLGLDEREQPR
jgi:hypothetical protein